MTKAEKKLSEIKPVEKITNMSNADKEKYLINKFQEACKRVEYLQKQLAALRGGKQVDIETEINRPDEAGLKT